MALLKIAKRASAQKLQAIVGLAAKTQGVSPMRFGYLALILFALFVFSLIQLLKGGKRKMQYVGLDIHKKFIYAVVLELSLSILRTL